MLIFDKNKKHKHTMYVLCTSGYKQYRTSSDHPKGQIHSGDKTAWCILGLLLLLEKKFHFTSFRTSNVFQFHSKGLQNEHEMAGFIIKFCLFHCRTRKIIIKRRSEVTKRQITFITFSCSPEFLFPSSLFAFTKTQRHFFQGIVTGLLLKICFISFH